MLMRDVPQWVHQSFTRSIRGVGSTATTEQIDAAYARLCEMWTQPGRYHHDIRHLLDMLKRIDTLAPETTHADWIRLAAWFHGVIFSTSDLAVYTRNGGEDEIASAKLAREYLTELGVSDEACQAVTKLIIGLKTRPKVAGERPDDTGHVGDTVRACDGERPSLEEGLRDTIQASGEPTTDATGRPAVDALSTSSVIVSSSEPNSTVTIDKVDIDQLTLRDAHLGALAVEPQKYKHYIEEIREEYAHIPRAHFLRAREQIVRKLLARKKLFNSPLAASWEQPARENLEAELERLKGALAELESIPVAEKIQELDTPEHTSLGVHADESAHDFEVWAQEHAARAQEALARRVQREQMLYEDTIAMNGSSTDTSDQISSLEKLDDMYSPGKAPKTNMSPEEAEREARKKTAEEAWQVATGKITKVQPGRPEA